MSSSPASEAPVPSPCCRRCCLDEQDVCLGCGRSLAEVLEWNGADGARRRQIIEAAAARCKPRLPWR
ncbi:DUF1289 domain-containing protein [Pseudomonas knackmussii]|uniref:DUF1289 domain-containing protein n=1 Tax=Pseudomonas knackmussii TaxID=65741 RepID=UPI0009FBD334|nr:DUF1289 domain-containing protein [Pseudomonas knackmussii]